MNKGMFTKTQQIDSAFRHIRLYSLVFLVGCSLISGYALYSAFRLVDASNQKVYILADGKVLEALAGERKDNLLVEARDHIHMFHHYFFTLDPDDKVITDHITRALYLSDASAKKQYDNLKESGYYSSLIAANISQQVQTDSVQIDTGRYPFFFRFRGLEKLIRTSSILTRSLVTEGYLRNVSRSDNNSHGFLIERWVIVENKDLKTEDRQ